MGKSNQRQFIRDSHDSHVLYWVKAEAKLQKKGIDGDAVHYSILGELPESDTITKWANDHLQFPIGHHEQPSLGQLSIPRPNDIHAKGTSHYGPKHLIRSESSEINVNWFIAY